jgi:hypothetical protein
MNINMNSVASGSKDVTRRFGSRRWRASLAKDVFGHVGERR